MFHWGRLIRGRLFQGPIYHLPSHRSYRWARHWVEVFWTNWSTVASMVDKTQQCRWVSGIPHRHETFPNHRLALRWQTYEKIPKWLLHRLNCYHSLWIDHLPWWPLFSAGKLPFSFSYSNSLSKFVKCLLPCSRTSRLWMLKNRVRFAQKCQTMTKSFRDHGKYSAPDLLTTHAYWNFDICQLAAINASPSCLAFQVN